MTTTETAAILRQFNEWRRDFDDKIEQPDSRDIGMALDAAVEMIERLEVAEKERDAAELMSIALRAKVDQSVPDGWKLVPIVSSDEMDSAGSEHCDGYLSTAQAVWDAMLAAAPEARP